MLFNPTFLSANTLIDILSHTKTATAVHVGEQAHIQFANDAMIKIWGKDHSVIGKSLEEALPELKGQPFIDTLQKFGAKELQFPVRIRLQHLLSRVRKKSFTLILNTKPS